MKSISCWLIHYVVFLFVVWTSYGLHTPPLWAIPAGFAYASVIQWLGDILDEIKKRGL